VSVLGVSKVQWKGQGEMNIGDYIMYYSGGERAKNGAVIVVHKSVGRSIVKKIAIKLQAEIDKYFYNESVHANIGL
jgi:hypothetical protein